MKLSHIQTDHVDKLLKRVSGARRTNQRDYLIRQYLGSYDAKLHATCKAYDAMRPDRRPDKTKLESIARDLEPRSLFAYTGNPKTHIPTIGRSSNSESKTAG
jgi:hypothetical protein